LKYAVAEFEISTYIEGAAERGAGSFSPHCPLSTNDCEHPRRIAMRCLLRIIGLAALLQFAASGVGNAALNYTGQTAQNVSVMYFSLPANTKILIVDQISGVLIDPNLPLVSGSGSLVVPLSGLKPGEYYLLAQQAGQWIAQTVMFYF
jgi:hypothetical protein